MKISYIAPIDRLRGAIKDAFGTSGIVAADSQTAGKWARRYVRPANNMTPHQVIIRGFLAAAAVAYKGLTLAQAAAWESTARAVKRLDALGAQYEMDGIELFTQVNVYRQMAGESIVLTVPALTSAIAVQNATATAGSGTLTIAGDCVGLADTANLFIRVTPAMASNSQARHARPNEVRCITTDHVDSFTNPSTGSFTKALDTDAFAVVQNNRIGIEIRSLDANYVQGGVYFASNVAVV